MNAKSLRKHLLHPLAITFALLWLGTMVLLTSGTCKELEVTVESTAHSVRDMLDNEQETYLYNIENNYLGDEADNILATNLSYTAAWQIERMENGIALAARNHSGTDYIRSQITWGHGEEQGGDASERWYFYFDNGLDDDGQIALAKWLVAHRTTGEYALYPKEQASEERTGNQIEDGTFARVTGIEQAGRRIDVQKIEIVYPDGTTETMVETTTKGIGTTREFRYFKIYSALLPNRWSNGRDDPINMKQRLESYRSAQAILEHELGINIGSSYMSHSGKRFTFGSRDNNGKLSYGAMYYELLPGAMRQNIGMYLSTAILTLIVLLALSKNLSHRVTFPVECLVRDVNRGKCRTDRDISELNTLADAFNDAQEKIQGQLERERAFTRAAAHELKTPLAILRAHAECAMEDIAPKKRGEYLNIVLEESDRMAELVSGLLELARLESDTKPPMDIIDLAPILREALEGFAPIADQKGIVLTSELTEMQIKGSEALLHKIISNLLSNALRHTPEGGAVTVSLDEQEENAVLTVDNDGAIIPNEHLPHLFEPFYRVDSARNRTDGGTGLGLTIVRAAVLAHGGSCEVHNRESGVAFRIVIPKK